MNRRTYKRAIIGIIMGMSLLALAGCFILSLKLFFRIFLVFLKNPLEGLAASVLFLVSLGIYNLLQEDETIQN